MLGNHGSRLCQSGLRVIDEIEQGGDWLFVGWDGSIDLLDLGLLIVKGYLFAGQNISLFVTLLLYPDSTCPQCACHIFDMYGVDGFLAWTPTTGVSMVKHKITGQTYMVFIGFFIYP